LKPCVAVVVPALELGGGVPSVAEFICQTLERSGAFDLQLISLAVAARDRIGVSLTRPSSWVRGVRTHVDVWRGRRFTRVGAFLSEFEFQRFQPRRVLAELLTDCALIQVVSGSAAAAWSVCGLGKPVAVQCASRAIVERRRRASTEHGPKAVWRRSMTRIIDRMDRRALRTVDAVQVENRWMFDYVRQINLGRTPIIRYAPPGVDVSRFRPIDSRNLQSDAYILCVGRLDDPRKNVHLLLQAYANLPAELKGRVRLVMAGSTGPSPAFWERAKALNLTKRIEFVSAPDPDALIGLYQRASVFVLSSDEEGLGMVILEAMACGVPVVSTRSGGPEGIIADGTEGYLVDLNDVKAMTNRLARLLSDETLNRSMGKSARETILRKYESGVAGKTFLEIYDYLLSACSWRSSSVTHDPRAITG
jgi:glycosyltransferase involved in cell wall biosynthesis